MQESIVGEYTEIPSDLGAIELHKFVANTVFKDFLHKVIAGCGDLPEVLIEAKRIGRGIVTFIDHLVPDLDANQQLLDCNVKRIAARLM